MPTPLDQLADCLHDFSDAHAFCIGGVFYTYKDLQQTISSIQESMVNAGVKEHGNIGFLTYDDLQTYASVFAILFSGHAFVPVNPLHPIERNLSMLRQAGVKFLLSSKSSEAEIYRSAGFEIIDTTAKKKSKSILQVPLPDHQVAYILFTSGSTGIPKGVPITVRSLNAFLSSFFELRYNIDETDRFLQMFDLTFDLSIMSYMVPLCIGACVYTVPFGAIKYQEVFRLLEEHKITVALLVPSILNHLRRFFSEIRLEKMKYSLFCGEALMKDLAEEWSRCIPNASIINTYGPTEATIFCMTYDLTKAKHISAYNGFVSIGEPMKGVDVCIVDEELKPVASGEKGELCLAGEQLTNGYWKNESQNKSAFFNYKGIRYYRTGDICFAGESGDYFFAGRIDSQVKINGFRVELGEIEHCARNFLKTNAAAFAIQNESSQQIILVTEGNKEELKSVENYLREQLPDYMVPTKYFSVPEFPLNVNGKLDRNVLLKLIS